MKFIKLPINPTVNSFITLIFFFCKGMIREAWQSGHMRSRRGYKGTEVLPRKEATDESQKTPSSAWGRPVQLCVISSLNYYIWQTHFHLQENNKSLIILISHGLKSLSVGPTCTAILALASQCFVLQPSSSLVRVMACEASLITQLWIQHSATAQQVSNSSSFCGSFS